MKKWICVTLCVLMLVSVLSACGGEMVPPPPVEPDVPPAEVPENPSARSEELGESEAQEEAETPEEAALQALLESMTLREKVGQLFFVRVPAQSAVEDVKNYLLGGYIFFGRDTMDRTSSELIGTIASYQAAAGIPLLIGVDEEGGSVVRVSSNHHFRSRKFASPRVVLQNGSVEDDTREKALLLKALGFNINLAPVADVSTNPKDFMYDRTTGRGAEETAAYVTKVVEISSSYGLGSVLKHFPGYGDNNDTHTGIAVDNRLLEDFQETDLIPFQRAIDEGKRLSGPEPAVLVSHNIVSCMDAEVPASLSSEIHRILREDMDFDGVIMTDDLAMDAVAEYADDGAVAVMAIQAGNDLVITTDYRTQIPKVIEAVREGTLDAAAVDAACLRVLRWKLELGLLKLSEQETLEPAVFPQS